MCLFSIIKTLCHESDWWRQLRWSNQYTEMDSKILISYMSFFTNKQVANWPLNSADLAWIITMASTKHKNEVNLIIDCDWMIEILSLFNLYSYIYSCNKWRVRFFITLKFNNMDLLGEGGSNLSLRLSVQMWPSMSSLSFKVRELWFCK